VPTDTGVEATPGQARPSGGGAGRLGAAALVEQVLDADSWRSWDEPPEQPADISDDYRRDLAQAQQRAGTDEAVITGRGSIAGRPVAVIVGEFRFLAGSIGHAASARLVRAIERATREGLPLLAAPASGGTRMQEGTPAFVGMVKIAAAIARHKAAGLPYIVYLRHPTTGGVFASWGSLGHFTAAEPGALIGFLGPRVYEALYGRAFPEGVQRSENLVARGLIDATLEVGELAGVASEILDILMTPREQLPQLPELPKERLTDRPAWDSVLRSRRPDRPGVRTLLRLGASSVIPLSGTGEGERDESVLLALVKFGETPCVLLGQDRRHQAAGQPLGPAALREARRGMRLAQELQLPLVSVVDTAGADLSREAEEGALAGEIARCLSDLVTLAAPTVSVLLGEGTGGGALALLPADRVICAEHAWLSPLPPEGAAAIVHRDVGRAAEMAEAQQVRSVDLLRRGIVDRIVAEPQDAADDPEAFCRRVAHVLQYEVGQVMRDDPATRLSSRLARYDALG
jgi:acetyl-CoA carboxylase carboxyl transferase subunit beta